MRVIYRDSTNGRIVPESYAEANPDTTQMEEVHDLYITPDEATIEGFCEVMHDAYEKAAAKAGWETNSESRVPWADVPDANKVTMRASVRALIDHING